MATSAGWILPVFFHELTQRERLSIRSAVFQTRNVRRRRRWRRTQQILQQPLAAQNDRRSVCIRIHSQQAALTEDSTTRIKFRSECHTPEVAAVNVRDSIMTREAFIKKRILRIQ